MVRGSRSRGKPRKQTLHSLANDAIAKHMERAGAEEKPEAFAAAQALLERARIENVRELSTLDELDYAVDILMMRPLESAGSYLSDLKTLQAKHQYINEIRARITQRRKHLSKKSPQPAVA